MIISLNHLERFNYAHLKKVLLLDVFATLDVRGITTLFQGVRSAFVSDRVMKNHSVNTIYSNLSDANYRSLYEFFPRKSSNRPTQEAFLGDDKYVIQQLHQYLKLRKLTTLFRSFFLFST